MKRDDSVPERLDSIVARDGIESARRLGLGMIMILAAALSGDPARGKPLETVETVDLGRYLGTWYEIASYPAWFQRGCTATTAQYSMRDDGLIRVVNRCHKGHPGGPAKSATGRARVVDSSSSARLEVSFFGPFWGDYWIIDLDPDYQWAVVGEPRRKYLWILSRTPELPDTVYQDILSRLPAKGYDPERLRKTVQP